LTSEQIAGYLNYANLPELDDIQSLQSVIATGSTSCSIQYLDL
jgi:hypothetical protein